MQALSQIGFIGFSLPLPFFHLRHFFSQFFPIIWSLSRVYYNNFDNKKKNISRLMSRMDSSRRTQLPSCERQFSNVLHGFNVPIDEGMAYYTCNEPSLVRKHDLGPGSLWCGAIFSVVTSREQIGNFRIHKRCHGPRCVHFCKFGSRLQEVSYIIKIIQNSLIYYFKEVRAHIHTICKKLVLSSCRKIIMFKWYMFSQRATNLTSLRHRYNVFKMINVHVVKMS